MKKLLSFIIFVLCISLSTTVYAGGWARGGNWGGGGHIEVADTTEGMGATVMVATAMAEDTMAATGVTDMAAAIAAGQLG